MTRAPQVRLAESKLGEMPEVGLVSETLPACESRHLKEGNGFVG